jgi:haloacid dehalogenase superfamily, subfamily IA, variant 1 with third motif having Dx(3-4)D or Dx(3-4)E
MKNYDYFLFDADGTLIDTMELIYRCFVHTCRKFADKEVSKQEVQKNVGLTLREQMAKYFGPMSQEFFDTVSKEHMAFQLAHYLEHLRLFPTVAEGLAMLSTAGKHCAVVTSRRRNTLELYLKKTGIFHFFEAFVTPETTLTHKPGPEPALAALSLMGAQKNQALFVGDAEFDIECASRAGIDSAFVKWSSNDPLQMSVKPTWFIDDFKKLYVK